jgi:hypothetical protein
MVLPKLEVPWPGSLGVDAASGVDPSTFVGFDVACSRSRLGEDERSAAVASKLCKNVLKGARRTVPRNKSVFEGRS